MQQRIEVRLNFTEDERQFVPADQRELAFNDAALIPQEGDFILLAPRSMWRVAARVWEQVQPQHLRLDLWLLHAPEGLTMRKRAAPALVPPATRHD